MIMKKLLLCKRRHQNTRFTAFYQSTLLFRKNFEKKFIKQLMKQFCVFDVFSAIQDALLMSNKL